MIQGELLPNLTMSVSSFRVIFTHCDHECFMIQGDLLPNLTMSVS